MRRFGTFIAAIVIVVVAFFIGRLSVQPWDGNPIGYHLHGLAIVDQSTTISACTGSSPCTLSLDVYSNDGGNNPMSSPSCSGLTACSTFHNLKADGITSQMTLKIDEAAGGGYNQPVYATGAFGH